MLKKALFPVVIALIALSLIYVLPAGAQTGDEVALTATQPILPGSDLLLSSGGSQNALSPEIAVSDSFAAVVYQEGGTVYLRSATEQLGWMPATSLTTNGLVPRLIFEGNSTVHVIWQAADGSAIRYTTCALSIAASPVCGAATAIRSGSNLTFPDIVLDSSGVLHAAWVHEGDIETARSTDWTARATLGGVNANKLALATSNGFLHLVFVTLTQNQPNALYYYRSLIDAHSWQQQASHQAGEFTSGILGYDYVDNPAIGANGSQVYIVWDNLSAQQDDIYGLTGAFSNSNGDSGSWPKKTFSDDYMAYHIISTTPTEQQPSGSDQKASLSGENVAPLQLKGLRPSVVLSGTELAVVWHQRPVKTNDCGLLSPDNGTGEIYFAYPHDSWSETAMVANDRDYYSFDGDAAIDPAGRKHIVFTRGEAANDCRLVGGSSLGIYYRGPFKAPADLQVTKSGPVAVDPGQEITYTLVAINRGGLPASDVVVTDTLPAEATHIRGGNESGGVVEWDVGSLAAEGGYKLLQFVITGPRGLLLNDDYGIAGFGHPFAAGSPAVATLVGNYGGATGEPLGQPQLAIFKTGPVTVKAGEEMTYTLVALNLTDNLTATGVVITDSLPGGAAYVRGGSLSSGVVSWNIGDLDPGASEQVQFAVTTNQDLLNDDYRVTANESFATGKIPVSTRLGSETTYASDMALFKTGPLAAGVGQKITYTLVALNLLDTTVNSVYITDTIPAEAVYIASPSGSQTDGTAEWFIGNMPGGKLAQAQLIVSSTEAIVVNGDYGVRWNGGNATGSVPFATIISSTGRIPGPNDPNLSIRKTAAASLDFGGDIVYNLIVINSGQGTATNLTITDQLPANVQHISGGTLKSGNVVEWTISSLAGGGTTLTRTLVVRPLEPNTVVTNQSYQVETEDGFVATAVDSVETAVGQAFIYLPVILK